MWENNPNFPVNRDIKQWYANNCILNSSLRKEVGNTGKDHWGGKAGLPDEGDKSVALYLELLSITCLYKKVDNCCFFINVRDFPILRKDGKHPYEILYCPDDNNNTGYKCNVPKIVNVQNLISVYSQSKTKDFLDKLLPTEDEIGEVLNVNAIPNCTSYRVKIAKERLNKINWDEKKDIGLFRGSLTGCAVYENNQRIQLSLISLKYPDLIDSKITKASRRIKKDPLSKVINISPPYKIRSPYKIKDEYKYINFKELVTKTEMTNDEQAKYKYIIIVEGFVSAFRMARMLSWGSLIINIDTRWKMWFEEYYKGKLNFRYYEDLTNNNLKTTHGLKIKLVPEYKYKNKKGKYYKINEKHLIDTIKWCKNNDKICHFIAENGVKFWERNLNKNSILNYTSYMLNK